MCGIVGYVGSRDTAQVLMSGLSKLEYRGYDSAGIAVVKDGSLDIRKAQGRLSNLEKMLGDYEAKGATGIGHTRWATHGEPSQRNSHPHSNCAETIAVVHNGIIENYMKLKQWLISEGAAFSSETDTEVVAHLINHFYDGDLLEAVRSAIGRIEGSYALGVVSENHPGTIIAARKDSPLVVGIGQGENIIASDIPALLAYTRDVIFLGDKEIAMLTRDSVKIHDEYGRQVDRDTYHVEWDAEQAEKGGYEHFMIKEIHEEPKVMTDTLKIKDGMIDLSQIGIDEKAIADIDKVGIIACGTAYHAGMVGKYIIEDLARIPVEVEIASEFRYRKPIIKEGQLVIIISQSGETADTLAAMREAKKCGAKIAAVVNVVGSTIAREADAVLYTHAGPEIAVASTKAYNTQLIAIYMIALELARLKKSIDMNEYTRLVDGLSEVPKLTEKVLDTKGQLQRFAAKNFHKGSVFFIGRGLDYVLSMEASLKLKEISYIHSEAYAAGELKHGTIALIEDGTLVVAIVTQGKLIEKTISNIKEVKARGAKVLAVCFEGTQLAEDVADEVVYLPKADDVFAPILTVTPMQLFAYYMSVEKGCDVDKPRNLAKSVTVE
ncbi:MAG: glutamine--fructose-6-phosphate transaminase (isomerizing) [Clostridia bacterium]|jgi:glutamine---fructose-6-phosphate transaminase (isomerizing)|nr:glutamine--fructose-6-phosphate transaminase (isomerizing) [Clostridia bacterium]